MVTDVGKKRVADVEKSLHLRCKEEKRRENLRGELKFSS